MKNIGPIKWNLLLPIMLFSIILCSCKKFIEVQSPVTSVNEGNVYNNDNTATSVLTALYAQMSNEAVGDFGITSLSKVAELSADNLALNDLTNIPLISFYRNNLNGTSSAPGFWSQLYQGVYQTNAAIEGLNTSTSLTPLVKRQLLGEAQFMRAFFYFYLVNLYGDIPLVLVTNYKGNAIMGRTDKSKVYEQIITDLKSAKNLLSQDYLDVTLLNKSTERIRPNRAAATALLARVYLFSGDFIQAEAQSSLLLNNDINYKLVDLDKVFLRNSKETIWSLQPVIINFNTWESRKFILPSTGPNTEFPLSLSKQLIASFDADDKRLNIWTGDVTADGVKFYYAYKYKAALNATSVSEYGMVLRLAEQYLVRAEARVYQNKLTGINSAASDLDAIRLRAGLLPTTASTKQDLLDAILKERQHELFTEWGHRWFDLKRTNKIDEVMSMVCPLKGGVWQSYKALYPIPQVEINRNPGMTGQQNPGYSN